MSDPVLPINIAEWVGRAQADPVVYQQRQAIAITLNAIAMAAPLNTTMILKGGTLMGLVYDSPRLTADIDLTTTLVSESDVGDRVQELLDSIFPLATATLGYADLVVKTHSVKTQQRNFPDAEFPALKLRIGSAKRGTAQETALLKGNAAVVIDVDVSFNEPLLQIQVLELTGGQELFAYSLVELIAEKYRAILQQVPRDRYRRQDIYDLDLLIRRNEIDEELQKQILTTLETKCKGRRLHPTRASLDDPEIKMRAGADWQTLELELGEVPDFEGCFARVSEFYRSLPWRST